MSAGAILTLGLGSFGSVNLLPTLGYTGAQVTAVVADSVVGGGIPSRRQNRRRYIMPDGTMLEATTQEAFEWLQTYSVPAPVRDAPRRAAVTRAPAIVLEKRDVRFIPATDSAPDTWKAVLDERFTFKAPADVTARVLARMRQEEDAMVLLCL